MNPGRVSLIVVGSAAALVACAGDLVMPLLLARHYPGYSHLRDVESLLGTAGSPVGRWMSLWWIGFGALIILFAVSFGVAFRGRGAAATVLTGQLALFGAMAGIAAGLFPMDVGNQVTLSGRLHNILGGVGFIAIVLAPATAMLLFRPGGHTAMFVIAAVTLVAGLAACVVYIVSEGKTAGLLRFTGLWQRLFLLSCYVFVSALAIQTMQIARARP